MLVRPCPSHHLCECSLLWSPREIFQFGNEHVCPCHVAIEQHVTLEPSRNVDVALKQSTAVFGVHLNGEVGARSSTVLKTTRKFAFKLTPCWGVLVAQILRNEFCTDTPAMPAFGINITQVPRLEIVQQIVQQDQNRTHTFLKTEVPLW